MRCFTFSSVDDGEVIRVHGDYVVASGKHPWIFRRDGTYIAKIKKIRRAYGMVFLSGDRVLFAANQNMAYYLVSLKNGEILWSCDYKGPRQSPGDLVMSPSEEYIYLLYHGKNWSIVIDRIEPEKQKVTTYIPPDEGDYLGGYCTDEGNLIFLLCRHGPFYVGDGKPALNENDWTYRVVSWFPGDPKLEILQEWTFQNSLTGRFLGSIAINDKYILSRDLYVTSINTKECFYLLENNEKLKPNEAQDGIIGRYDPNTDLLEVWFLKSGSTAIIHCKERKIVSHYARISHGLVDGCFADGEFWIGTRDGLIKRPFPNMDPFPRNL